MLFPESHPLSAASSSFPFVIRDRLLGVGARPSPRTVFTVLTNTDFALTLRLVSQDRIAPNCLTGSLAIGDQSCFGDDRSQRDCQSRVSSLLDLDVRPVIAVGVPEW